LGLAGGGGGGDRDRDGGGVVDLVYCGCGDERGEKEEGEEGVGEHFRRECRVSEGAKESNVSDSRSLE